MSSHQAVETKVITAKIKPAYRPSSNCRDLNSTLTAAAQMALAYKCEYQIIPTHYGWDIITAVKNPTPMTSYYQTDGKSVTLYSRPEEQVGQ